ncbi:AAA family ATPase [Alicyclobacillus suci]|uniref:AAA family ATPase n=1 Tax=Alicyclobacillus suci TaxID=2816080 RepID=UPI001A8E7A59|nr:AAA family ATPase [Alicyclobacillus suci]
MQILLLDDSIHASSRMNQLKGYKVEHCRTMREVAGMTPELVIVDEATTPEAVRELQEWGLSVCMVAERVTVSLRRKYPMLQDMVTMKSLLSYVKDHVSTNKEPVELKEADQVAATQEKTVSTSKEEHVVKTVAMPSVIRPPVKGAHILGFLSLRNFGGGSGKTGVLYNFAAYAAEEGCKTLVVDLDPKGLFGYLAGSQQDLTTHHWTNLMRQNPEGLSERAVFDNIELHEKYGFYMITAASREEMIRREEFRWILEQTRPYFDLILFDMPSTWEDTTLDLMQKADKLYMFGLYDQMQYVEFKKSIQSATHPLIGGTTTDKMVIMLGRAYIGKNREIEIEEVRKQLGVEHVFLIPEDPLFQRYRNQHKAIVLEKPAAASAKAMVPWLEQQLDLTIPVTNLPALYKPKKGVFEWLFGSSKRKTPVGKEV